MNGHVWEREISKLCSLLCARLGWCTLSRGYYFWWVPNASIPCLNLFFIPGDPTNTRVAVSKSDCDIVFFSGILGLEACCMCQIQNIMYSNHNVLNTMYPCHLPDDSSLLFCPFLCDFYDQYYLYNMEVCRVKNISVYFNCQHSLFSTLPVNLQTIINIKYISY